MNAYVATPSGSGPFPAVMVFHEAFGVNSYIKGMADKLAKDGYLAIAPELYHRTAPPGFEARYYQFSMVMAHAHAVKEEDMVSDILAVYKWLHGQEEVNKNKIGCIGFSLGGRVAFIANSAVKLNASVSFYGGLMHTVAARAASLSGPQLMFWGGKDETIKQEHVDTVLKALRKAGKEFTSIEMSYADHGFFCDEQPAYHSQHAKEAWVVVKEFLKSKLK